MGGRFSFRRVALLLRSDAECVCPALLKVTLGAGFFLFLYFLATYGYDGSGIISVTTDAAMRWKGSVSKDCLVLAMVFGPSFVYAGMARPDARLAFMMRPASAAEKFVGRLLLSTVGVSALVLLAVAVADLLHLGFSLAAGTSDGLRSVMASLARETAGSVSDIFRPAPHDWPAALAHGLNAVAGLLFFPVALSALPASVGTWRVCCGYVFGSGLPGRFRCATPLFARHRQPVGLRFHVYGVRLVARRRQLCRGLPQFPAYAVGE